MLEYKKTKRIQQIAYLHFSQLNVVPKVARTLSFRTADCRPVPNTTSKTLQTNLSVHTRLSQLTTQKVWRNVNEAEKFETKSLLACYITNKPTNCHTFVRFTSTTTQLNQPNFLPPRAAVVNGCQTFCPGQIQIWGYIKINIGTSLNSRKSRPDSVFKDVLERALCQSVGDYGTDSCSTLQKGACETFDILQSPFQGMQNLTPFSHIWLLCKFHLQTRFCSIPCCCLFVEGRLSIPLTDDTSRCLSVIYRFVVHPFARQFRVGQLQIKINT